MVKIIYLVIIIILALPNTLLANDEGYKYYENGQYEKALSIWTKEVEMGNTEALYNIGLLYYFGKGVKKDLNIAFDYCKKAAYRGSGRAQNNLAYMHMKGLGTKKNYIYAYAWSSIAVENGYNSQGIKDDVIIHLTPAMLNDANKLILSIIRELVDE